MDALILVSNPGSESRKYALYRGEDCLATVHFEHLGKDIVYSIEALGKVTQTQKSGLHHLSFAPTKVWDILEKETGVKNKYDVKIVVVRVVAPSSYFAQHRALDKQALAKLKALESYARLHVHASMQEIELLGGAFPGVRLVGASDSAFHMGRPEHTNRYGIPAKDADNLDIKRFSYHGLSARSVIDQLRGADKLPQRLVIAHLGSGVSVMAIKSGKSFDSTMGFSPLEGPVMATRSGSIDPTAAQALKQGLKLSDNELQDYLNHQSGLLGLSGTSSDIRDLLKHEADADKNAKLALKIYAYKVQQAIGQMTASLGGLDTLVFTGTVGERSAVMRSRIVSKLLYLGLSLNPQANHETGGVKGVASISPPRHPAKVYVVHADETAQMSKVAQEFLAK